MNTSKDTESTDSDTRKSVFPKFEPGNTGRNLLLTVVYGVFYPVGIVAMFYGFIRKYRDDEERVMGWGENLLTLWLGLIVAMVIIVGSLGAAGIIPEEAFSDDSSPAGLDTTEVSFSEWQEENSDRIEAAETSWEDGEDKVVEAEEMEPSLVDGPIDLLEDAHGSYEEAQTTFGALEDDALSNAEQYPDGSREHELFTTAAEYYRSMESAALFRKTAISIIIDNPDGDISQSEEDTFYARLEQSESHYEDAQAARAELKELLNE